MQQLTLGFSPCPNDTFIFDALVNHKIQSKNFNFFENLADVETLNQWALEGKLDITKLSFPAYFKTEHEYDLLDAGSALGKGVGPLLISNKPVLFDENLIENCTIFLPGENTTAHLLFSFAFPNAKNKEFLSYQKIEEVISKNKNKNYLGVIIHESRFTYQQKGLFKVLDLGKFWEDKLNAPVPLGAIVIKKKLGKKIKFEIEKLIRKSIEISWKNYPNLDEYIIRNAQEMELNVMRSHIELYVNEFTNTLGKSGYQAIKNLQNTWLNLNSKQKT